MKMNCCSRLPRVQVGRQVGGAVGQRIGRAKVHGYIGTGFDDPAHILMGQGKLGHQFHDGPFFGLGRFHVFAPGGHIEEKIPDGNGGSAIAGSRFPADDFTAGNFDQSAQLFPLGAADAFDLADRGDAGQGLTPKSETGHLHDVRGRGDFTGGVALEGQGQVTKGNAVAVVLDGQQSKAAILHGNCDLGGPGVQGVFHQFLHDRTGSLDHLTGRDSVDGAAVENPDFGGFAGHAAFHTNPHGPQLLNLLRFVFGSMD